MLAFFTRGHINDSTLPSFIDTDNALAFFTEVLHLDPDEVSGKFELWACSKEKSKYFSFIYDRQDLNFSQIRTQ